MKARRRLIRAAALALVVGIALTGCGGANSKPKAVGKPPATTAAPAEAPAATPTTTVAPAPVPAPMKEGWTDELAAQYSETLRQTGEALPGVYPTPDWLACATRFVTTTYTLNEVVDATGNQAGFAQQGAAINAECGAP